MLRVILFAGSLWRCCSVSGMMNTFQSPLSGSDFRGCGPGYKSYCISREIHHIEAFVQHMHTLITFAPLHRCKWWKERVAKKKTGTSPMATTSSLTYEEGWNILVRSKSCYEPLKHEKLHEDETGPTRSLCLCSIWHLKINQENTVFNCVRVRIMHSCAFVRRSCDDHFGPTEAAESCWRAASVHFIFFHAYKNAVKQHLDCGGT